MDQCQFEEDMKAYADTELSWPHRIAVRRHLAHCASCRKELTQMTKLGEQLRKKEQNNPLDSVLRARILGTAFADVQGPVFNARQVRQTQDRILKACFSASVAANLLFVVLVSHSDLFGRAASFVNLREKPVKIYTPVPVKPQLKPPKMVAPPPPPKQRPQPPIKRPPLIHISRPQPTRVPTHIPKVATPSNRGTITPINVSSGPDVPKPNEQSIPNDTARPNNMAQTNDNSSKSDEPLHSGVASQPDKVEKSAAPTIQPLVTVASPPPATPDREEPEIVGSFDDLYLPSFDPTTVSVSQITATWDVNEQGHPSGIHLSPKSSGNSDVDAAIIDAIRKFRFKPRVHNGKPQPAEVTHTFTLGG